MSKASHILVIDDDSAMRSMISDFLKSEGHKVTEFSLATEALHQLLSPEFQEDRVDLVLSDLNMPEMSGIEFISKFKEISNQIPVILVTAFGSIETAIEAIRKGAFDYTTKPFKFNEMRVTLNRALKYRALQLENRRLMSEMELTQSFRQIIGKSPGMQEVFDLIKRVAPASANILITGESGTGKERVATAIHNEGPRRHQKFVAINCTAIPESLLESELFGHSKGAFTGALTRKKGLFEEAEGGTLFLDEIGDMNLSLQAKLLRVLQERKIRSVGDTVDREVDVRIIAATHKDLKASIKNGTFREDLYYRLSVIPIVIPPLRHRREDIPLLADTFLKKYSLANHSKVKGISKEALATLINMPWEGNVRELENLIERAVVLSSGERIEVHDLPKSQQESDVDLFLERTLSGQMPTLEDIERKYFKYVLEKTGGRKEKAAQILGVNRRTLYRKEREYGLISDIESSTEEFSSDETEDKNLLSAGFSKGQNKD